MRASSKKLDTYNLAVISIENGRTGAYNWSGNFGVEKGGRERTTGVAAE